MCVHKLNVLRNNIIFNERTGPYYNQWNFDTINDERYYKIHYIK